MARKAKSAKNRISSSNLFLMELIIALLLFSVASAACVSIFMRSHQMSERTAEMNTAVDRVSSAAELLRGCDSLMEVRTALLAEYPGALIDYAGANEADGDDMSVDALSASIWFDKNGQACEWESSATVLVVETYSADSLIEALLTFSETDGEGNPAGESLCSLPVTHYSGRTDA